jgi:hypothetical protein
MHTALTLMTNCSNTMCPRSVSPQQLTAMAGYAAENRDELETQKKRVRLRYLLAYAIERILTMCCTRCR